jgi:hypothetical protein
VFRLYRALGGYRAGPHTKVLAFLASGIAHNLLVLPFLGWSFTLPVAFTGFGALTAVGPNVYRASSPTGPWILLASNVVDMDDGTPNIQYVDQPGDVGSPWCYQVAAWNDACGTEGPW